jgi:hypothetical protein
MEINSPEQFVQAVNASLAYMNKVQRKAFVHWVHDRVRNYNFNYPNGMPQTKESTNASDPVVVSSNSNQPIVVDTTVVPEGGESSSK